MSDKRDGEFHAEDLDNLSVAELEEVKERATELIAEKSIAEKQALRDDIEALLEEHGLKLVDVFEELAPKKRGRRPSRPAEVGAIGNGHDTSSE